MSTQLITAFLAAHWPLIVLASAGTISGAWLAFAKWRHVQEEKIANTRLRTGVEAVDKIFTDAVQWGFDTLVAVLKKNDSWTPASQAEVKNSVREKVLAELTPIQIAQFAVSCGIPVQEKTAEQVAAAVLPFLDSKIEAHVDTAKSAAKAAGSINAS